MTTHATTPDLATLPFTPEPGLPWLRTDPAMQTPEAFIGMSTVTPGPYAPMSRHFPAGTTLAMTRVTSPEQLTEGVYWYETTYAGCGVRYHFGRFAGLMPTSNERAQARRLQKGRAHIELAADALPADLRRAYLLREDGTQTCYVDFKSFHCKLWRITHYVSLPATALATLDESPATGTSPDQQRWLREEQQILSNDAAEFTARVLGGFPEADCRAVLFQQQMDDFNCLLNSLPRLLPSQAKRRKSGAVAITWRCYNVYGTTVALTDYFRRHDADLLLGYLQSTTDQHRAEARVQAHRLAVAEAAVAIRAARQPLAAPEEAQYELASAA